jgi:uncharacterized membrane protein/uncharacterized protein (UPF0548 family)
VAEWRFGRGWSEAELADRLRGLAELPPSAPAAFERMTREEGWREVRSEALIAREPPGAPLPRGPFERAWEALATYAFSDPRIVEVHYDPQTPFVGRRLLLELRPIGLRFLCGVVIRAERRDSTAGETVRGFRYDTLAGHIERGGEWFLLSKDRGSGEVRFRIHARWRPGDLPNAWSRLGFTLLGRRYQRQWHRRAHHRLSVMAKEPGAVVPPRRDGRRLAHRGVEVTFSSWGGADERRRLSPVVASVLLGATTGVRSFAGLATVTTARGHAGAAAGESRLERWLAEPAVGGAVELAAAGEMVADKLPGIPPRTEPLPLLGRVAFGALVGALVGRRRQRGALVPALVGGAAAAAAAVGATRLRQALARRGVPDLPVGLAEDALVLLARRALRPSAR